MGAKANPNGICRIIHYDSIRLMLCVFCFLIFGSMESFAVNPQTRLTQYGHTAWRVRDGYFAGAPNAITQTMDGYIWIGTGAGLLRFDGAQFQDFRSLHGRELDSNYIVSLLASQDGSLYVGSAIGLTQIRGGELHTYGKGRGRVNQIIQDSSGSIWFARSRSRDTAGPLCQVLHADIRCVGPSEGLQMPVASAVLQDRKGDFWIAGTTSVLRWDRNEVQTYTSPQFASGDHLSGFNALIEIGSGQVLAGLAHTGAGLGIEAVENGRFRPWSIPEFNGSQVQATSFLRDREGSLWIGTANEGLYRWNGVRIEHYRKTDGLSGDAVNQIYEDREGVIWVATSHGIDNFRDLRVLTVSTSEGLPSDEISGLSVSNDGSVWLGYPNGLAIVQSGNVRGMTQRQGLPGKQVTSLLQDEAGQWWIGVDQSIFLYSQGRFKEITENGKQTGPVISLVPDHRGGVWAVANGKPPALLHIQEGGVTRREGPPTYPRAGAIYVDQSGASWVGYTDGSIAFENGSVRKKIDLGLTAQAAIRRILGFGKNGPLILTQQGLYGIRDGRPQTLGKRNGLPDEHLRSGVFDLSGNLWLMCDAGILQLSRSELERWWKEPSAILQYELLTASDGVLLSQDPFEPNTGVTPDNRVWFATEQNGVEVVSQAPIPLPLPPVRIESFQADHIAYALDRAIRLPPRPRNLMINYAGLSFASPANLQFRYRLDGHDTAWMDAGGRRTAYFEDLKPGKYRFHVLASNQAGVWNQEEAVVDFVVLPAWYQTTWFTSLWVLGLSALAWIAYRLRIRTIAAALNARFDERLAERTRMARELHDTFLQTVQSSKIVADSALADAHDEMGMSLALEQLSDWLGQAVTEGRTALRALRASTIERNHLADALRTALDEFSANSTAETEVRVSGTVRDLHPIVRAELCQVGAEAIRNAIIHAKATRIIVELNYGRSLVLQVSDDGVGIPDEYLTTGKEGHFGLTGMRERTDRIGAQISITSSPEAGTRVDVTVPYTSAYLKRVKRLSLKKLFSNWWPSRD